METLEKTEHKPVEQTYEEYVESRLKPEPPPVVNSEADEPTSAADNPENTADSDKKPKRDRSAEARIHELNDRAQRAEAERDEWRRKAESANQAKPSESPKTDDKPAPSTDKPLLKDFVAKLGPDETYEDAQERWEEAKAEWRQKQAEANAVTRQQEEAKLKRTEKIKSRFEEAKTKHPDFDEVINSDWLPKEAPIIQALHDYMADDGDPSVLYYLAQNPEDVARIKALSPYRQSVELGKIEDRIYKPAEPEPKPRPVSNAPPPPSRVGGGSAPPEADIFKAKDFSEYQKARQRK